MDFKSIWQATVALGLIGISLGGCGNGEQSVLPEENVPLAPTVTQTTAEPTPYIVASEDFTNLQIDNAQIPVYDKLTLKDRRAIGLTTVLPSLFPYHNGKIAYLTFDDGPDAENTPAILDILRDEQVKATFYVIGKNAETHPDAIMRIFAEGHAIGNHSYDHNYDRLYASVDDYLDEMEQTDEVIHNIIGVRPLVTRAPGGGTYFTEEYLLSLIENGYVTHDWNVSSADTDPNDPTAQDFVDNIESQSIMENAIILMHCSQGHEETVKALPQIIQVLRDKGYTFGVITPMTPQPYDF